MSKIESVSKSECQNAVRTFWLLGIALASTLLMTLIFVIGTVYSPVPKFIVLNAALLFGCGYFIMALAISITGSDSLSKAARIIRNVIAPVEE